MSKTPLTIIVGSKNPVKVNAVQHAMAAIYPGHDIHCEGVDAPSLVADQPMTEDETRQGAVNRMRHCQSHFQADYYVAIEGGVHPFEFGPATFAYIAIANQHKSSIGRSALQPIPNQVFAALEQHIELGTVMDKLFDTINIKQKGGAIGLLTNHLVTRESAYNQAIIMAMAPFVYEQLFA